MCVQNVSLGYTAVVADSLVAACGMLMLSCYSACTGIKGICFTVSIPY
jgi:hypothetical protein